MTRPTGEDAMSSEHVEVLERLRGVLEHGKMGDKCLIAPDLVTAAIAALSAPQPPAEAQPDWEVAPPGATHYQPHQDAYYKRVSASEWYVWSREDDREVVRWLPSPGTSDSAEWVVPPAEAQAVVWCPACDGTGWGPDSSDAEQRVTCPDCAGSGSAEHSITANEAPSAPVGVEGQQAARALVLKYAKHFDAARFPEAFWPDLLTLAQQPPTAPDRIVLWSRGVVPNWYFIAKKADRPDIEGAPVYEALDEIILRGSPEAQQPAAVDLYVYDDSRGPCSDGCCGGCFYSAYEGQQPAAVDRSWDELEIIVKGYLDDPHADAEYVLRKIAALAAQQGDEK